MKTENDNSKISVLYVDTLQDSDLKGLWSTETITRIQGELSTLELKKNLKIFCNEIGKVFDEVTTEIDNFELDEFELNVAVTAKGDITLIGSVGGEIEGGIKLVFRRSDRLSKKK